MSQALKFGTEFIEKEATEVNFSTRPFKIFVNESIYESKAVIVATGMIQRKLGLDSEDRLLGRGVFVCATCDALLYEDKKVAVIGGGDSALQEALDLSKYARQVFLIHRRSNFTANKDLIVKIKNNSIIQILKNTIVEEIFGEKKVEAIKIKNLESNIITEIKLDGVLIAIGWIPNTKIYKNQLELDSKGYIFSKGTKTSVKGVFAAGEIIDPVYRQVVTSCGSGAMAGIDTIRYLESF